MSSKKIVFNKGGVRVTEQQLERSYQAYVRWRMKFEQQGHNLDTRMTREEYADLYGNAVLAHTPNIARTFAYNDQAYSFRGAQKLVKRIKSLSERTIVSDMEADEIEHLQESNKKIQEIRRKYKNVKSIIGAKNRELVFKELAMQIDVDIWNMTDSERREKYGKELKKFRTDFEATLYA